jgi:hypothetical protein
MTPALFRAVYRRVATSHTGTKGIHHGTHFNRTPRRTQNPGLPSMARHQQRRRQFLDKSRSRMAPPRRQRAFADTLGHPDERADRPSPTASQAVTGHRGALIAPRFRPNGGANWRNRLSKAVPSRPESRHQVPCKMWERMWFRFC